MRFFSWRSYGAGYFLTFLSLAATGFTASTASAQTLAIQSSATISLSQALELAWQRTPAANTASSKSKEIQARQQAATSLLAGSPAVTLAHRTDRLTGNNGLRELEAEIGLPLWNAGTRSATQRQLNAESRTLEPAQALAKLQLAGQLRELSASIALAQLERQLTQQKLAESTQLASDMARRLSAGDVARLDVLQLQLLQAQSQLALSNATAQLQQLQLQWQGLTGSAQLAHANPSIPAGSATTLPDNHPALLAAQAQLENATARLSLAEADRADPMDLAFGISRERSAFGNSAERNLRAALRIPLGTSSRNAPKLAAARLELDAAQAELDHQRRSLSSELALAQSQLSQAQTNEQTSAQRLQLARQMHEIVLRAYNLGERDLPTRLRADAEKFEAELSASRAQLETRRALSKLHQQLGLLP